MQNLPTKCPTCGSDMFVTNLCCGSCNTQVSGSFTLGPFASLNEEQMFFLATFIRLRGSLKDVGAALDISYPTARNRLDQVIEALGYGKDGSAQIKRLEILEQVKEGNLTVEDRKSTRLNSSHT